MSLKQVFIINSDFSMGKGKIAVQVAHGEVLYMEAVNDAVFPPDAQPNYENYIDWRKFDIKPIGLMKKIVLKATEKEIHKITHDLSIRKIWYNIIHDHGLTQVPENSLTCVVIEPLSEDQCAELFGYLKLL